MSERILRKPELFSKVGISDTSIWRLEKAGKFPRRVALGGNSTGWLLSEVDEWIQQKAGERKNKGTEPMKLERR